MSAVAEIENTELVTLPPRETALLVYSKEGGLDPLIDEIRKKVVGTVYDMTTIKGRAECASDAFKVAKSKTAIEKLGKTLSAEYKEIPKKIDAERRRAFDALEALQAQVRQPLTEWETAEERRIARHKANIELFRLRADENSDLDSTELRLNIDGVGARIVDESYEEFEAEAHRMKARALDALTSALVIREKYEADQAELARLREEAETRRIQDEKDRIAREAVEAATKAAEVRVKAEREAAAQREAEAKAATERAEAERAQAIERQRQAEERAEAERLASVERAKQAAEAARLAEVKRQADEAARVAAEQKAREADTQHKAEINNKALAALVAGGLADDDAKRVIVLIAKGKVPGVRIEY